jgi:hypothetical protein
MTTSSATGEASVTDSQVEDLASALGVNDS